MPFRIMNYRLQWIQILRKINEFFVSQYGHFDGPLVYPLLKKDNGTNVGYVQIIPMENSIWEIGYHVAKKYTCNGYATEAIKVFLPVMTEIIGIREVYGICLKENKASIRVLEKCGFEKIFSGIGNYQGEQREIFHDARQVNVKILWCNIAWLFTMSFIPFVTAWVGYYPTSWIPLCLYFGDMSLACITFHLMYYLIFRDSYPEKKFKLGPRNIISLITYFGAAVLGGFCPIAAYIIVAVVSLWWVIPEKG